MHDWELRPDRPSPYTRALLAAAGCAAAPRATGLLDALLVAALIELRSHERFARLLECERAAVLHEFLAPLAEAEARHGAIFVELALEAAPARGRSASASRRWPSPRRRPWRTLRRARGVHSGPPR